MSIASSKRIRSGLYYVTTTDGHEYTVEDFQDWDTGEWSWRVTDGGLDGYYGSYATKREALSMIEGM